MKKTMERIIVWQYTIKEYLKTKIKSYDDKIDANFHGSKAPKKGSPCLFYQ